MRIKTCVYFEDELKEWLQIHAIQNGTNVSHIINDLIVKFMRENSKQDAFKVEKSKDK